MQNEFKCRSMFPTAETRRCGGVMYVGIRVLTIYYSSGLMATNAALGNTGKNKKTQALLLSSYISTPVCKPIILLYHLYRQRRNDTAVEGTERERCLALDSYVTRTSQLFSHECTARHYRAYSKKENKPSPAVMCNWKSRSIIAEVKVRTF